MKIILSILKSLILLQGISGKLCPNSCVCTSFTTNCTGLHLTSVPTQIPKGTKKLILRRNVISLINIDYNQTENYFSAVKFLDLSYNKIRSFKNSCDLEYFCFELEHLQYLDLSFNLISFLDCNFFFKNLKYLDLSYNSITEIKPLFSANYTV